MCVCVCVCVCARARLQSLTHKEISFHFLLIPFISLIICLFVCLFVGSLFDRMSFVKLLFHFGPFAFDVICCFSQSLVVVVIVCIRFFSTLTWIMNTGKLVKCPSFQSNDVMDNRPILHAPTLSHSHHFFLYMSSCLTLFFLFF